MLNALLTMDKEKDDVKQMSDHDETITMHNDHDVNISTLMKMNDNVYHEQLNFCFVYATPDGYAIPDGGSKGGYLIRGLNKVFLNEKLSLNQNLDAIIIEIRNQTRILAGNGTMVCVEDVSTMNYKVLFAKRKVHKL